MSAEQLTLQPVNKIDGTVNVPSTNRPASVRRLSGPAARGPRDRPREPYLYFSPPPGADSPSWPRR